MINKSYKRRYRVLSVVGTIYVGNIADAAGFEKKLRKP